MEKKNTMLLTVIAVATLLVAVVGATFAYFSLTVEGGTSTTAATMQTQQLPTITMKNGESTFGIAATVQDMAMNNSGARWAMYTGDDDDASQNASSGKDAGDGKLYYWSSTEVKYDLFNIKASKTSDENDALTYECPVTITLTGKEKVDELEKGDLILYLYSKDGDVLVSDPESAPAEGNAEEKIDEKTGLLITDWEKNDSSSYLMEKASENNDHANGNSCSSERGCYDVSDLFNLENDTKILYTVVIVQANNTSNNNGTSVQASMKLINKASDDQSGLAGQNIQITLASKLAEGGCKVITKKATD